MIESVSCIIKKLLTSQGLCGDPGRTATRRDPTSPTAGGAEPPTGRTDEAAQTTADTVLGQRL